MSSTEDPWKVVTLRKSTPHGRIVQVKGPVSSHATVNVGGHAMRLSHDDVVTIARPTGNKQERPSLSLFKKLDSTEDVDQKTVLPTVSKSLGQKISQARNSKGLTRKQLAAAINEVESVVSGVENGTALFKMATLQKINRILGTTLKRND